jgi:hypothetical protein
MNYDENMKSNILEILVHTGWIVKINKFSFFVPYWSKHLFSEEHSSQNLQILVNEDVFRDFESVQDYILVLFIL